MKEKPNTWLNPPFELADATALQALAIGEADKHQQLRAIKWIIEEAAGVYRPSYRSGQGGERDTIFCEGRRNVGLQIVTLLKLDVSKLRRNDV